MIFAAYMSSADLRRVLSNVEMNGGRLVRVGQRDGGSLREQREVALPVAGLDVGYEDELERLAVVQDVKAAEHGSVPA